RDHPLAPADFAGTTHLLVSIPPDTAGDPALAVHVGDIAALGGLRWLGYLSTTGVYGDRRGGWVDEGSALTPSGPRSTRRGAAERAWLALGRERGPPGHIFRPPGIYWPGRRPLRPPRARTRQR